MPVASKIQASTNKSSANKLCIFILNAYRYRTNMNHIECLLHKMGLIVHNFLAISICQDLSSNNVWFVDI